MNKGDTFISKERLQPSNAFGDIIQITEVCPANQLGIKFIYGWTGNAHINRRVLEKKFTPITTAEIKKLIPSYRS